jgi:hypothetical protein
MSTLIDYYANAEKWRTSNTQTAQANATRERELAAKEEMLRQYDPLFTAVDKDPRVADALTQFMQEKLARPSQEQVPAVPGQPAPDVRAEFDDWRIKFEARQDWRDFKARHPELTPDVELAMRGAVVLEDVPPDLEKVHAYIMGLRKQGGQQQVTQLANQARIAAAAAHTEGAGTLAEESIDARQFTFEQLEDAAKKKFGFTT